MKDNLDIVAQLKLNQSAEAIQGLQGQISTLEESLRSTEVNLTVKLDESMVEKVKYQFAEIQEEVKNFKDLGDTNNLNNSLKMIEVVTEEAANKLKDLKSIADESSEVLYRLSGGINQSTNAMLSLSQEISNGITSLILTDLMEDILRSIKEIIETVKILDEDMTQVAITTGMSGEEIGNLALQYVKLSEEIGRTAGGISKANRELITVQDLSPEESFDRLQNALKLCVAEGLETNEGISILTSSIDTFGEEAERAGDMILSLGKISGLSIKEIGKVLDKVASSGKKTGIALEQFGAVLSTLAEIAQRSPPSLVNSLDAILLNFDRLDKMSGVIDQDFSSLKTSLENLAITFINANGQMIPTYYILEELSYKWQELDWNTKAYIANLWAGMEQQSSFIAVMENFNRVQSIHNDLLNSAGTLSQRYAEQLNSIQGSTGNVIESFGKMYVHLLLNNEQFNNSIKGISNRMVTQMVAVGKSIGSANASMGLFKASAGIVKAGFKGITLSAIGTKAAVIGVQAALTMGISAAITGIVGAISAWIGVSEKAKQENEQLAESVKNNIDSYENNIKSLKNISEEFDRLNEKLGENRDFTNLTAQEQDRYNQLISQLANISPGIVQHYDEKGRAIVDYGLKVDDLIEKQEKLIELENKRQISKGTEVVKSLNKEIKKDEEIQDDIVKEIKETKEDIKDYEIDLENNRHPTDEEKDSTLIKLEKSRTKLVELESEYAVLEQEIDESKDKQRELVDKYFSIVKELEALPSPIRDDVRNKVMKVFDDRGYQGAISSIEEYKRVFKLLSNEIDNINVTSVATEFEKVKKILVEILGYTESEAQSFIFDFGQEMKDTSPLLSEDHSVTFAKFQPLKDEIDELIGAFQKLASGEALSERELTPLLEKYRELRDYVGETGDFSFENGELFRGMIHERIANMEREMEVSVQSIELRRKSAEETLARREEELKSIAEIYGLENEMYKAQQKNVEESRNQVHLLDKEHKNTVNIIKSLKKVYSESFAKAEYDAHVRDFENMNDKVGTYKKILEEINKYGKLSEKTNREILTKHPELGELKYLEKKSDKIKFLTDLIDEYTQKRKDSYKDILLANVAFSNKFFDANNQLIADIAKVYGKDLNKFTTIQQLKLMIMENSIQIFTQKGLDYLSQFETNAERAMESLKLINNALFALENNVSPDVFEDIFSMVKTQDRDILLKRKEQDEISLKLEENLEKVDGFAKNYDFDVDLDSGFSRYTKNTFKQIEAIELLTDRYLKFNKALEMAEDSLAKNSQLLEYATSKDRINLLAKEIKMLKEKQQILHLTANEYRRERDELEKELTGKIDLGDGSLGIDSFNAYTRATEDSINAIISQINSAANDKVRDSLTKNKDEIKKEYDEIKKDFERYLELESSLITDLETQWWSLEFEKFNKSLEIIDTDLEKYARAIDNINDRISLMIKIREDNTEELEEEYSLLKEISKLYENSLNDVANKLLANRDLIDNYEKQLKALGDHRGAEYQAISRRLILLRAEEDKLFERRKEAITALADHQKVVIDKYISKMEQGRDKTIASLEDIRKDMNKFSHNEFNNSIEEILLQLNEIDKIFLDGAEFQLSTSKAREDLGKWKEQIMDTLHGVDQLQVQGKNILATETHTEEEAIEKRERLIELIEKQTGKERELKDLQEDLRDQVAKTALEHQKIEDALKNKINAKEEELKQLQEQFKQEDKVRAMLEKQLGLMRAMDDVRHSYITGQGEEIFTYDQSKVAEIQRNIAEMTRRDEREEMEEAMKDEIAQMKEDLSKTKEIHSQELEVLKLAQEGIEGILDVLSHNIDENIEGLENIYDDVINAFIDAIKENMEPLIERFLDSWEERENRSELYIPNEEEKAIDDKETNENPAGNPENEGAKALEYVVKPHDTLSKIAEKFGTTVSELLRLNPDIQNPDLIFPDQRIKIPRVKDMGVNNDFEDSLILGKNDMEKVSEYFKLSKDFPRDVIKSETVINNPNIGSIENYKSVILNNPTFHGITDVNRFADELNNLFRKGMSSIS